jgi:DNA-binding NarL/FixJ family response regulator
MILELLIELRADGSGGDLLTAREAQVLSMLRRGHSTGAIAERLKIAPVTVRRHISGLVHKLGVDDRFALVGTGMVTTPVGDRK